MADKEIFHVCQRCAGTGKYKDKPCTDCNGTGRILFGFLVEKVVEVKSAKKA